MGDVIDSTLIHIVIKGTHTERKGNEPTGLILLKHDYYFSSIVSFCCSTDLCMYW